MSNFYAFLVSSTLLFISISGNAQTQIKDSSVTGTSYLPQPGAILELESNQRALLLPRVEPVQGCPTTAEGSAGYPVLNGGVGEYYWDGGGWVAKKYNAASAYQEPLQIQNTTAKATGDTDNVFQMGTFAIGKNVAQPGTALDVEGAVHFGSEHSGTVGANSAVFGGLNTAAGISSAAFGTGNLAAGDYSFVTGQQANKAYGQGSVILGGLASTTGIEGDSYYTGENSAIVGGLGNNVTRSNSFIGGGNGNKITRDFSGIVAGASTTLDGDYSMASGWQLVSSARNTYMFGRYNAVTGGDANAPNFADTDALLQIGSGNWSVRRNVLTILQNGLTAIGVSGTEDAAKPTELLDLGGREEAGYGGLKIRNINSQVYTGNPATDRLVVADANGVLKTINSTLSSSIVTKATDYTPLTTDETILVNAGSGARTVILPVEATAGKRYTVKKIDATSNAVTLDGAGGSIDGSSSVQTNTPYQGWIV